MAGFESLSAGATGWSSVRLVRLVGLSFLVGLCGIRRLFLGATQPIALPRHRHHFRVLRQSVQDSGCRGDVPHQLPPVFQSIASGGA